MNRILITFAIILISCAISAQKTKEVKSTYEYAIPEHESIAQAKTKAIELAKVQAIEEAFGLVVFQDNRLRQEEKDNKLTEDFLSMIGTDIKGEWIEDFEEPKTEIIEKDGVFIIKAEIHGKIREIIRADIDIQVKILRNGITAGHESDSFISGNDLYMLFSSPCSGYLTVYLLGENGDAFCLLPYKNAPEGVFRVNKNKEYTLFHTASASIEEQSYVDEYVLTADQRSEVNFIYIIFSPNEFTSASGEGKGELIPQQLPYKEFQEWLTNNRNIDHKIQVVRRAIDIKQSVQSDFF